MPIPFILGGAAIVAGAAGIKSGVSGGKKMKNAKKTMDEAKMIQGMAVEELERNNKTTTEIMDQLGRREVEILASFEHFQDVFEKIQNRPEFKEHKIEGVDLPKYVEEELRDIHVGAKGLLTSIEGAVAGYASAFAAGGAAVYAVSTLGVASTGTAISALSGAAATNATLAFLGGGSLAAGGGGMALGATVLSGATLGVGLLAAGFVVGAAGKKLSNDADEAYRQAKKTEEEVEKIVEYLQKLCEIGVKYRHMLENVNDEYEDRLDELEYLVNRRGIVDWNDFSYEQQIMIENLVLLVGLLYKMCQVQLVLKENEEEMGQVNEGEVRKMIRSAECALEEIDEIP